MIARTYYYNITIMFSSSPVPVNQFTRVMAQHIKLQIYLRCYSCSWICRSSMISRIDVLTHVHLLITQNKMSMRVKILILVELVMWKITCSRVHLWTSMAIHSLYFFIMLSTCTMYYLHQKAKHIHLQLHPYSISQRMIIVNICINLVV